jgi:hypothetical protein
MEPLLCTAPTTVSLLLLDASMGGGLQLVLAAKSAYLLWVLPVSVAVDELQTMVVLIRRTRAKLVFSCWQTMTLTVSLGGGAVTQVPDPAVAAPVEQLYGVVV